MQRFAIRNAEIGDHLVGILRHNEDTGEYVIELPAGINYLDAPPIISEFIQKGDAEVSPDWSLRWVQSRVIPPERQNIGQIMRELKMDRYDEFPLLLECGGRSCQDGCYIVRID